MTLDEHKARHVELHGALDELLADFITHTERRPSEVTVLGLLEWSHKQTTDPDENCDDLIGRVQEKP